MHKMIQHEWNSHYRINNKLCHAKFVMQNLVLHCRGYSPAGTHPVSLTASFVSSCWDPPVSDFAEPGPDETFTIDGRKSLPPSWNPFLHSSRMIPSICIRSNLHALLRLRAAFFDKRTIYVRKIDRQWPILTRNVGQPKKSKGENNFFLEMSRVASRRYKLTELARINRD